MTNKAQDDKNMKILRQLSNEPDNKKCMDCGIKGTVYVCSNFNTFICTACSGLHREFNHRVKSISMTTFKPEEIKNLQAGGNAVARKKWLARWSPQDFPEPDSSDATRVKQFMKLKYIDRRWFSETGEGPQTSYNSQQAPPPSAAKKSSDHYPAPEPLSKILGNDIPPIQINGSHKTPGPIQAPAHHAAAPGPIHAPPAAQQGNSLVDWNAKTTKPSATSDLDELLSLPSPQQQSQYQQQLNQHQQQMQYQQQQQLIMSQFGQQGAWGQPQPGYFNPYGGQPQPQQQQQQPGGFYGVQTPPNFFSPPPPQAQIPGGGAISPTFGQPFGSNPTPSPSHPSAFGNTLSPAQPSAFGNTLSPAQPSAFGNTLSPAQPSPAFGGPSPASPVFGAPAPTQGPAYGGLSPSPAFGASSNSQPSPGFGGAPAYGGVSPSLHSAPPTHSGAYGAGGFSLNPQQPQQPQQPQPPAADKFDIFAALSPLSGATASNVGGSGSVSKPHNPPLSTSSHNPHANPHANNPNPFGDPFGSGLNPTPATSQPQQHSQHLQPPPQQQQQHDPFGFGGSTSPSLQSSKPTNPPPSSDPFGFGGGLSPTSQQQQQPQHQQQQYQQQQQPQQQQQQYQQQQQQQQQQQGFANPFGGAPATSTPAPQSSSAFSPFAQQPTSPQQQQGFANPFGQQQQTQQTQPQQQQSDPWGNPFNF